MRQEDCISQFVDTFISNLRKESNADSWQEIINNNETRLRSALNETFEDSTVEFL